MTNSNIKILSEQINLFLSQNDIHLTEIEWRIEFLKEGTILFYELSLNNQSIDLFFEKLTASFNKNKIENNRFLIILNDNSNIEFSNYFNSKILNLENFKENILLVKQTSFFPLQKHFLDKFYPIDFSEKILVGITGTNGKTTTAYLAKQLGPFFNKRAAALGTLGLSKCHEEGFQPTISQLTTPPMVELYKILFNLFVEEKHDLCFMEVSSHSLIKNRIFGLNFNLVLWTNFTQDHLDFHLTMDEYFKAKVSIKNYLYPGGVVLVHFAERVLIESLKKIDSFNFHAISLKNFNVSEDILSDLNNLPPFLRLTYNRINLELALIAYLYLDEKNNTELFKKISFLNLKSADGRFEVFHIGLKTIVIDFAHTPDALKKLCESIRSIYPSKYIAIVFGCGGNRDSGKRPLMGQISENYCDLVTLTSDNPRLENPVDICNQILMGISEKSKVSVIIDRAEAIQKTLLKIPENSVLILAGKGHEKYQQIGECKIPYSDLETVKSIDQKK